MGDSYLQRTGTIDLDAAAVTLRCVRGDSFETTVDVVIERPNPYVPGEILAYPLPATDWSWDSLIYERESKEPIGTFTIIDHPLVGYRITLKLEPQETQAMRVGTHEYWVDSINVDDGKRKTWLRGSFEVTRKPD